MVVCTPNGTHTVHVYVGVGSVVTTTVSVLPVFVAVPDETVSMDVMMHVSVLVTVDTAPATVLVEMAEAVRVRVRGSGERLRCLESRALRVARKDAFSASLGEREEMRAFMSGSPSLRDSSGLLDPRTSRRSSVMS